MRLPAVLSSIAVAASTALLASGCGASAEGTAKAAAKQPPACPAGWVAGWRKLAKRIDAPVYCPTWLPAPLTGQIVGRVSFGGAGGPLVSVGKDRSYLVSLAWAEPQSGEVHVNLRGYPGRTKVPTCVKEDFNRGKIVRSPIPCFSDERGSVTEGDITATVYTVNQDADLWHVLYAWHYRGGLYTVSQHVAVPLTYRKVVADLHRILRGLVVVDPG